MVISENKKKAGLYCCAYACKAKPIAKKGGLCHKHYTRLLKERDPVYDRYFNFRNNALRRGKEFTITLEQFRAWCERTGYIVMKGRRGYAATVDRRCNAHGYHLFNIQLKSHRFNCSKGASFNGSNFGNPNGQDDEVPF